MNEAARAGAMLEIDLAAIVANWRLLCARHPSGPVAAVVKADAYGLGAREVAPALYAAGCRHFFTALLDEALAIRDIVPDAMVAVLNGLYPGTEGDYVAYPPPPPASLLQGEKEPSPLHEEGGARESLGAWIVPVLGSMGEIDAWAGAARAADRRLPAILHIDTGMSRLGLGPTEMRILRADPRRLDGIDLRFVMTHLVSSETPEDMVNETQRRRFEAACAGLPAARRSIANSSGIFLGPAFASDLARPGAALYGINPMPGRANAMRDVVRLRARVLAVREIAAGETVGYNATWRAERPSRIATAAIGYADGWHRSQSGRGVAIFDGRPVPLVGRVSMDLTTFDATDHPALAPGQWLELIGPARTPDDVAVAARTNGYEVLTSLGRRFHRVYLPA
jgi:alanine racemase